ncbi:MAG: hypothetical protein WKG52_10365, partial [Variovorax sp.]
LWSCEQALRCADVAAVLAWLPQVRVGGLRRLQLAAAQHESLLFVFRPESAAQSTSPARLRLQLATCEQDRSQVDVHILKRRGPPLASAIQLPARSERMAALLAAGQLRRKLRRQDDGELPAVESATVVRLALHQGRAMHWIALQWQPEADDVQLPPAEVLGWWALRFTPRVAWVDEALLIEVSACERLWGGRLALMREMAGTNPAAPVPLRQAQGATRLIALARLRMFARGEQPPAELPAACCSTR